jgi:hypothetical protein
MLMKNIGQSNENFNQFIKNCQENFATRNAIYFILLPRTIFQIANDNSLFHKEGIIGNEPDKSHQF